MTTLSPTPRSRVHRGKKRAQQDRAALYDVLDSALVCHLAVTVDGLPFVVPTAFGHDQERLYLHGSSGARSLRGSTDLPVCVAVTVLDGVVYARSVFHHSMNYRAAIVHGTGLQLEGDDKLRGLRIISEHTSPGSWDHCRLPNRKELAQTSVLAVDLHEASVKLRAGGPVDDDEDYALPVWAGVLPVRQVFGAPEPDPLLAPGLAVPAHVENR